RKSRRRWLTVPFQEVRADQPLDLGLIAGLDPGGKMSGPLGGAGVSHSLDRLRRLLHDQIGQRPGRVDRSAGEIESESALLQCPGVLEREMALDEGRAPLSAARNVRLDAAIDMAEGVADVGFGPAQLVGFQFRNEGGQSGGKYRVRVHLWPRRFRTGPEASRLSNC